MPTTLHEIPLALLDEEPSILLALLRAASGPALVADEVARMDTAFAELAPATYAADRVYVAQRSGQSVGALVVEMQRAVDDEKRWRWPAYLASAHARLRVPTWLVVLTLDARVASWAGKPLATFHDGSLRPVVIGPEEIPRAPAASLELSVLAAMAHGRGEGEVGGALALHALARIREAPDLDRARARLYTDVVLASLDEIARHVLEATMDTAGWEWQSDQVKAWVAEGKAEGISEGERRAVRVLAEALGLAWTDEHAARVARASQSELDALLRTLARERRWPE